MNKKQPVFVTIGIPSLFLIFSVLCLVIFALLTLGTSRMDLQESQLSMEQTTAYYDACTEATEQCIALHDYLLETYKQSDGERAYFSTLEENLPSSFPQISWDKHTRQASFHQIISQEQQLHVVLSICYPRSPEESPCEVLAWEASVYGQWEPDTTQKLLFS